MLARRRGDEPRLVARGARLPAPRRAGELDLERFELLVAEGREALAAGDAAAARPRCCATRRRCGTDGRSRISSSSRSRGSRSSGSRSCASPRSRSGSTRSSRSAGTLPLVAELERARRRAPVPRALPRAADARALPLAAGRPRARGLPADAEPPERRARARARRGAAAARTGDPHAGPGADPRRRRPAARAAAAPRRLPVQGAGAVRAGRRRVLLRPRAARRGARRTTADAPLLALVGPSGSGKSSLLRAGLLPALGRDVAPCARRATAAELVAALGRARPGEQLVLAVDQLEELFAPSVGDDERHAFVDALVEAAWDPERRAVVLLALRADFFGHLARYAELADLVGPNHVLLGPLSASRAAPRDRGAGASGRASKSSRRCVDALVDDVAGEPGGLPLLSTALVDLWRERDGSVADARCVRADGRRRGAVARHAEAAFADARRGRQDVARRILLRLVARRWRRGADAAAGGACRARRRRRPGRRARARDARRAAAARRRRDERSSSCTKRCSSSGRGSRAGSTRTRRAAALHRAAHAGGVEWDASGREPGELYRGARLAAALEWADAAGADAGLNRLEREFLKESRTASRARDPAPARAARGCPRAARRRARRRGGRAAGTRHGAATRRRRRSRSGWARRRSSSPRSTARCCSRARASRSTTPPRRGATCSPRSCGVRRRSPSCTAADDRVLDDALSRRRAHAGRPRRRRQRRLLRHAHAARASGRASQASGKSSTAARSAGRSARWRSARTAARSPSATAPTGCTPTSTSSTRARIAAAPRAMSPTRGDRGRRVRARRPHARDRRGRLRPRPLRPPEVLVARSADGRAVLRQSRPIAGGRLIGFTHDGRSCSSRAARRAAYLLDARTFARSARSPRRRRGALAGRGRRGVRPGRRQRRFLDLRTGGVRSAARRRPAG